MKRLILGLIAATCVGQTVAPEPDFADVFCRLDGDKLVVLERQNATAKSGTGGFVYVSMKSATEFPGAKSSIRFPSVPLTFVVKTPLASGVADPNTMFILRKLEQRKSTRRLVFMSGHFSPVHGSVTTNFSKGGLPIEFEKYGTGSLKITTPALPPGEYSLGKTWPGQAVFCFGVDEGGGTK